MNKKYKYFIHFVKYGIPLFCVVFFILVLLVGGGLEKSWNNTFQTNQSYYEEGWEIEEDASVARFPLSKNLKTIHMKKKLSTVKDGDILVIQYQYQDVTAYIDGKVIYDFEKPRSGLTTTRLGTTVIGIPLQKEYSGCEITLELTGLASDSISLEHILLTDTGTYLYEQFLGYQFQISISICFLVIAVISFILFLVLTTKKIKVDNLSQDYFLALAFFSVSVGLWILSDLQIIFIVSKKMVINDIMSHFSLMLIPIGFSSLVYYILKKCKVVFITLQSIFFINVFVQTILFVFGIVDLADMLIVTQGVFLLGGITILVTVIYSVFHGITRESFYLLLGLCAFVIVIAVCIFGYIFNKQGFNYNMYFLFSMSIIVVDCTYIVFSSFSNLIKDHIGMEQTKQFAYTDALTQIGNRRAYEDAINHQKSMIGISDLAIIAFDVNYLKKANDSLGHSAGDELLVAAASIIKKNFETTDSHVYRTGGDEFCAIVYLSKSELGVKLSNFEHEVDEWHGVFNSNLSIAYGYALKSEYTDISIEELSIKADAEMYSSKRRMHIKRR